jgi:hypothetical protein
LLVVLDRLNPADRLAFVLHDLFDMPFERSPLPDQVFVFSGVEAPPKN